jgi:DNA-binding NarL/FixJ family response regulator
LRLAEGKSKAADAAIRRVVAEAANRLRRAKLLPAYVEITLAVGDVAAARAAAAEFIEIVGDYNTPALRAAAASAMGSVLLADGDARGALVELRQAWQVWQDFGAAYEAARVRVLIGLGCRALGDEDSATLELEVAGRVFAHLGAAPALAWVEALNRLHAGAGELRLTARERQVLRLLAAGKTNRAIAVDLVVAEKTVDRHVTNLFTKLGVSSRAAATAYAYEHRLL